MKNDLSTRTEIHELAEEVLSQSELEEAYAISHSLSVGTKSMRKKAIITLYEKLKPSQPLHNENLHNAQEAITHLPQSRRNSIGYLVDYTDDLVKAMAFDLTKNPECKNNSLGLNVQRLNPDTHNISHRLVDNLQAYDSLFYTPAKNDFIMQDGQVHLLSVSETVYLAFITLKLADEITKASKNAKKVSNGRETIEDL